MKKIVIIMSALTLAVTFFTFEKGRTYDIVPVMTEPVTNKTIVIDAGHGKPDEGAVNKDGISEQKINLEIALKLKKLLDSNFANVILTRSDENGIYDTEGTIRSKKVSDMKNRVKIANDSNADIFVSIHLNKFKNEKYYGWQTFYRTGDESSKKLAESIQNNLNNYISVENKRTPQSLNKIYIMKNVKAPVAVVECGFLSNPAEAKLLQDSAYQEKLAWGIYNGIVEYFKQ